MPQIAFVRRTKAERLRDLRAGFVLARLKAVGLFGELGVAGARAALILARIQEAIDALELEADA